MSTTGAYTFPQAWFLGRCEIPVDEQARPNCLDYVAPDARRSILWRCSNQGYAPVGIDRGSELNEPDRAIVQQRPVRQIPRARGKLQGVAQR